MYFDDGVSPGYIDYLHVKGYLKIRLETFIICSAVIEKRQFTESISELWQRFLKISIFVFLENYLVKNNEKKPGNVYSGSDKSKNVRNNFFETVLLFRLE